MLFLFRLLAFPVTGPANGLKFILEQIREQALAEMLSEEEIESLLIESSIRHQEGEITDEEHEELEKTLLEQLRALRTVQSYGTREAPEEYDVDGRRTS